MVGSWDDTKALKWPYVYGGLTIVLTEGDDGGNLPTLYLDILIFYP